jgi:putative transposase
MPQSLASVYLHIVFSTKDRQSTIADAFQDGLYGYVGQIVKNRGCVLLCSGGTADHVHFLVSMSRQVTISDLMRDVKGLSSKWVRETHDVGFAWQSGYAVFSVGQRDLDTVGNYIRTQEEHHRGRTFREELVEMLELHEVEYDDRFLWG